MVHETHDRAKHRADAKAKIARLLADPKGRLDASDYSPPDVMDAEKQTYPHPPKKRAFKKGGKVEGEKGHHHSGRARRVDGGPIGAGTDAAGAATALPNPMGTFNFQPTHAGALANEAGLKRGGTAKHRDAGGEAVQQARANRAYQNAKVAQGDANFFSAPFKEQDTQSAMDKMNASSDRTGYDSAFSDPAYKRGGKVKKPDGESPRIHDGLKAKDRVARASGGKTKGKTNINIVIAAPKQEQPPMPPGGPMPMPHPAGGMGGFPPPPGAPAAPGAAPMGAGPMPNLPPASMGGGR
jgi:hypothetical protein